MSVPAVKSINYDPDITVVIPTLGEQTLSRTLKSIFEGSVVPHRILLCIPDEFAQRVKYLTKTYNRVEVRYCSKRSGCPKNSGLGRYFKI